MIKFSEENKGMLMAKKKKGHSFCLSLKRDDTKKN